MASSYKLFFFKLKTARTKYIKSWNQKQQQQQKNSGYFS